MAGCEADKKNFLIAYNEEARIVREAHPDWEPLDVKLEVARALRPKFTADMASQREEERGEKEGKVLDIELTADGDIRFPSYKGRTLTELNERTRTLTPWQYHPEDAMTNAAIRAAFAQGASEVVTSYWRPGEDHRDLVVMKLDRKTGKGFLKTVNVEALTGSTYKLGDISKQAEQMFFGLEIQFPNERVFVATDIHLDKRKTQEAVVIVEHQDVEVLPPHEESTETLIDVISSIKEEREEVIEFFPEAVLYDFFIEKKNEHIITALSIEPTNVAQKDMFVVWKKQAEELLHISPEQSEALLVEVIETWTMMSDAREVVSFVNDTGVGIAAAFYAIDKLTLTEESDKAVQLIQQEETIIEFVAETEMLIGAGIFALSELATLPVFEESVEHVKLTEKENKIIFSLFTPEEKIEQVSESIDAVVLISTIDFVRKIDAFPVEEQKKAITKEKEKIEIKIIHIWEAMTEIKPVTVTIHAPGEPVDLEPKDKQVEQFSFAFAIWTILKLMNYHSALEALVPQHSLMIHVQKEKPEGLTQKESAPWLLYAIIWYLAMIREQGTYTQAPPIKKKKKVREVVIYAYGSC